MAISATGIAVNLMLGFEQNNRATFERAKRFAQLDGITRKGKALTDYIDANKQAVKSWIELDVSNKRKAANEFIATGSIEPIEQYKAERNKPVEPILQKPKQYANKYTFSSVAFNTTNGTTKTRHVIKLERYYIEALGHIGISGKDVAAWLSDSTSPEWNETTGDKSIIKIVKAAIVNALVSRTNSTNKRRTRATTENEGL